MCQDVEGLVDNYSGAGISNRTTSVMSSEPGADHETFSHYSHGKKVVAAESQYPTIQTLIAPRKNPTERLPYDNQNLSDEI